MRGRNFEKLVKPAFLQTFGKLVIKSSKTVFHGVEHLKNYLIVLHIFGETFRTVTITTRVFHVSSPVI